METDPFYIKQRDSKDELYTRLQTASLDYLQRMSGKVWTDYNEHDPGVTITDILNYVLTEIDYRLHFSFEDYLRTSSQPFDPVSKGLFPPEEVFPVSPVTTEDYRKFFISRIIGLNNIQIKTDPTGQYSFYIRKDRDTDTERIEKEVRALYNSHRNLCEKMDQIVWITPEELTICAEIELTVTANPEKTLARLFRKIYTYLNGEIRFRLPDEMEKEGISPDIWMDGPYEHSIRTEIAQEDTTGTETELYHELMTLEGIRFIHSCHFMDEDGKWINLFDKPYTVNIPQQTEELKIILSKEGAPVVISFTDFRNYYQNMILPKNDFRKGWNDTLRGEGLSMQTLFPSEIKYSEGKFKQIYNHYSVMNEFPGCYGVGKHGVSGNVPGQTVVQVRQFQSYLLLFDLLFIRETRELECLNTLMSLTPDLPDYDLTNQVISQSIPEKLLKKLIDSSGENPECDDKIKAKEALLDLLDDFYAEDSDPAELKPFSYRELSKEEQIANRVSFLKKIPSWGKNRFKAVDITKPADASNISGMKAWMSTLLGWQTDEQYLISNILPSYNLILVTDYDYRFIEDTLPPAETIEKVKEVPIPSINIGILRAHLSFLNENKLYDNLLRSGIQLENYQIITVKESDYILIFSETDKQNRIVLGRSSNKTHLNQLANHLQKFLLHLNRQMEVMYVVEHSFFEPPQPFTMTVVVSGWTAHTANEAFRKVFRDLLIARTPAHIKVNLCWLNPEEMKQFEICWHSKNRNSVASCFNKN